MTTGVTQQVPRMVPKPAWDDSPQRDVIPVWQPSTQCPQVGSTCDD